MKKRRSRKDKLVYRSTRNQASEDPEFADKILANVLSSSKTTIQQHRKSIRQIQN